jgi:hypothetical protein
MLLFHNSLFWGSVASLTWMAIPNPWLATALVLLIGWLPPVYALLGTIWKDVSLGVTLLAAFSSLLLAQRRGSRVALCAAGPALLYALAVRHNAAPAILPFAVWTAWLACRLFLRRANPALIGTLASGLGLWVALIAINSWVSGVLTEHRSTYPVQWILLHDLTAISVRVGNNELPGYVQQEHPLSANELKRLYNPDTIAFLFCCNSSGRRLDLVRDAEHLALLERRWFESVQEHPSAYIRHRWQVASGLFGWTRASVCYPYHTGVEPNSLGVGFRGNRLNSAVMQGLDAVKDSILFRGGFYFVLSILASLGALVVWRRAPRPEFFVLASSALLYLLPYFVIATACDFRLVWWSALAMIVSPLMLVRSPDSSRLV